MTEQTNLGRRSRSVLGDMLLMVGGTGTSQVITALAALALTRIYSPADFGIFAVALAVFNVLAAVVTLRYDMAIVLARSQRSALNVMVLCLSTTLLMTAIAAILCTVSWVMDRSTANASMQAWAIAMIPLGVMFCGVQSIIRNWCIRFHNFKTISQMILMQTVVMLGIQVGAGVAFGSSPLYLMVGTVLGYGAMVATAVPFLLKTISCSSCAGVSRSRILTVARRHRRFPMYAMPYNFLDQLLLRFILIVLAVFVSPATLGQFALAQRVVTLPITVLTGSMSQVFYSRAAQGLGDPKLQQFVLRIVIAGTLFLGPFVAFNCIFGEQLFQFVFGTRWADAGRIAAWLGIASCFLTLTSWLDRIYDIRGRQNVALILQVFYDITALGALALAMRYTGRVEFGAASYALSTAFFYILWTYAVARIARFPRKFFNSYLASLAIVVGTAVAAALVCTWLPPIILVRMAAFALVSAPIIVTGAKIARNGMQQRETNLLLTKI